MREGPDPGRPDPSVCRSSTYQARRAWSGHLRAAECANDSHRYASTHFRPVGGNAQFYAHQCPVRLAAVRCQCVQSAAYRRPNGDAEEVAAVGGGHFREWLEARRQRAVPRPPRTSACRPRCSAAPAAAWTARTRPPDRPRRSPQQPHRSRAALHPRGVRTVLSRSRALSVTF